MAPQVQSSVMAVPQVKFNMHKWAGFMSGFPSLQSGAIVWQHEGHCSMISLRFSCRMVSLTAWKTKRMFSVSIAVVKWWKSGLLRFLLLRLNDWTRNAWKEQSNFSSCSEFHLLNIINVRAFVSTVWRKELVKTWRKLMCYCVCG